MDPAVLEGALALLLTSRVDHDVVQFHAATPDERAGLYDAAVVTKSLAGDVRADIVIVLPDAGSCAGPVAGRGMGHVTTAGTDREVELVSHQQVIDLLDEQFPLAVSRPGRVAAEG